MTSPVHQPGRAARWTTANIDEGLPGVVTPLTWSFYFPAVEEATRAAWFGLGAMTRAERPVPAAIDERFFTVVFGRGAANVDRFGEMADRMPGASAEAFEMQLFGSSSGGAAARSFRRYPVVAAKAGPTVRRAMRAFGPLAAGTDAWWRAAVGTPGDGRAQLVEARARFATVLNVHLVLTMVCQGLLERVAAVAAGAGLPGLERELIKSAGGT
ncbi:MAG: rifampicin phosphotransferase, partial [Solirubrobacteraceae bacterium]|nr:rifampicin phosphotransferase [Solirubrobacteraceae bacterium]